MTNLDDIGAMQKLDPKQMAKHIADFPWQIEEAAQNFRSISIPTHYIQVKNILILGMGGSAIGGELAAILATPTASIPIEVRRDYGLPAYVGKDTLVIAVSYSGNTEETLDGFRAAASRGAKLITVTTGGELASLSRKLQIPMYPIDYGSEPRAALGFLFTAVAIILAKLRYLPLATQEFEETAALLRDLQGKIGLDVPTNENLAKTLATVCKDRIPLIIGSGTMAVVAKRWKTQLNENGKLAAVAEPMPELCHNLIVGMERVYKQRDQFTVLFLQSNYSHPRNTLRMSIIGKQFLASKLPVENILMHPSGTPLAEALLMTYLGDYVSYYVAMQAQTDPSVITPIIDLKQALGREAWEPGK